MSNQSVASRASRQGPSVARPHSPRLALAFLLAVWPLMGAAQTGVNISGPIPWIDVTTYGAKGDAKLNLTGTTTTGSTTLSVSASSPTSFSAADAGKAISVNGAGLTAPTGITASITQGISGGLACGAGVTIYWQVTFIKENGSRVTSESAPNSESSMTFNPAGCTGANGKLTINLPSSSPTGATAWLPYVSYSSTNELAQPISGCSLLSTGGNGCSLTSGTTWNSGSGNLLFDTAQPPASPVLLTTIASVTNLTTVVLTDSASQSWSGNATVAWGTDNAPALGNAINACIEAAQLVISGFGCTIFVPGPTSLSTGRYFVAEGWS